MEKQNKYETMQPNDLLIEMAYLEREINMKLMIYEEMRMVAVKRFPSLEKEEPFQQKVLIKKEGRKNDNNNFNRNNSSN